MNDGATSSAAAAPLQHSPAHQQDALPFDHDEPLTAIQLANRQKKTRENFQRKRIELLDDLLRNVDMLVYAELSAVYYLDCRTFLFSLRAVVQFYHLTPKPLIFSRVRSNHSLGIIIGSNLLCILLHCFFAAPSAGEITRGYLHGGLIMDFIGQRGASNRLYLVLLDLLVLALQLVHLSAFTLWQRLRDGLAGTVTRPASIPAARPAQTVEDEERGVRRSVEQARAEDIEMQSLTLGGTTRTGLGDTAGAETDDSTGSEGAAGDFFQPRQTDAHIFDAFNSGQMVIADLDLAQTVKEHIVLAQTKRISDENNAENTRLIRQRLMQRLWSRIQ
ncbi:Putative DSC E3 ubiquitin ligase complex subunit 4 [Septoria linicola]|uniref:DSC E3 ubiquitin ligase complex subunit 4 n=1 Tax=Septoria linicola TaxID=215465 RepID=A0A9Q9ATN0_9PEZI|nr:Putative DSC E3 ubiquitin ligase complex subunit 4 [Septoria linicola]